MAGEVSGFDSAEQEARHPELRRLLAVPFGGLLRQTASDLLDIPEGNDDDPTGEWTANGIKLRFRENGHAVESVNLLRAARSAAAVYEADYKGIIGKIIQPVPSWAVSADDDGELYYWSQETHDGSPGLFVLGVTACEAVLPDSQPVRTMHRYLASAIYLRGRPDAFADLGRSTIPPLDLKARLGIIE